ncbi:Uncharacterised protein [Cronobacter universalis NCTC 9529]|uniref:Uncharacterized protein n=1 Tax=Cronobacter universalis NCTC 9529 TaxID=1074000 RepID=A0ABY1W3W4_9ENTR|nr:Uncharacterised protein [Cronobacter universalis NCTC 9529]
MAPSDAPRRGRTAIRIIQITIWITFVNKSYVTVSSAVMRFTQLIQAHCQNSHLT